MTDYETKEILIDNEKKYLGEKYPFENPQKLVDKRRCIHCDMIFQSAISKFSKRGQDLNLYAAQIRQTLTVQP